MTKMDETVEIYDSEKNPLGTALKSEAHEKGLWHRSVHCWVVSSFAEVVIQRRRSDKKILPGKWGLSAAGHVSLGESNLQACLRELKEELGIEASAEELYSLGERSYELNYPDAYDKEHVEVFVLLDNTQLADFVIQEDEVDRIGLVDLHEALSFFKGETLTLNVEEQEGLKVTYTPLSRDDFVPAVDNDYLKNFTMLDEFLYEGSFQKLWS